MNCASPKSIYEKTKRLNPKTHWLQSLQIPDHSVCVVLSCTKNTVYSWSYL